MTIVQGYVRDENNNLLPNVPVSIFRTSDNKLLSKAITGNGTTPFVDDIYYDKTSLLLRMNGANNGIIFTDESINNNSTTIGGGLCTKTNDFIFDNSSGYFNGTDAYLSIPYSYDLFDWWKTDYSLEAWIKSSSWDKWSYNWSGVNVPFLIGNLSLTTQDHYWGFGPIKTGELCFRYYNGSNYNVAGGVLPLNEWIKIRMHYNVNSNIIEIFINNQSVANSQKQGTPGSSNSINLNIGKHYNYYIDNNVSNVRITKGVLRCDSSFNGPTKSFASNVNSIINPVGFYSTNIDYSGEIYVAALTGLNNSGKNHLIKRAVLP